MSNYARQEQLDDFKSGLCSMQMRCGSCICMDCPRDCKECEGRGIKAGTKDCLYEFTGNYRKDQNKS